MYFNLRKPYMDSILSSFLVRYWARHLNMESPQTVPKDTLLKQNTPDYLLFRLFLALSFQNDTPIPPKRK